MKKKPIVIDFLPGAAKGAVWGFCFALLLVTGVAGEFLAARTPEQDAALAVRASSFAFFIAGVAETYRAFPYHGAIIIDEHGLGGRALFSSADERIAWTRIHSLHIDQRALVIEFEPADMRSGDPRDRISSARLSAPHLSPEELALAIRAYWRSSAFA